MIESSKKLIGIRQEITHKQKEIVELNLEKTDLWNKIKREFNENKARFRKMEGLSGLIQCLDNVEGDYILIQFDKNSNPSAHALSLIEDDTGLKFHSNSEDNLYKFTL